MSLTVAIPTMDRWSFLKDQLPKYLNNPRIACVLVSDENGNDLREICASGYDRNPKLRLYQNDRVLGVYGNKRQCFLKAPTEWVAVLDSDNWFEDSFFNAFFQCLERSREKDPLKQIYCAGGNERLHLETGLTENRIRHFSGASISVSTWNSILQKPGWNFLLNDGNAIWPKEVIQHFPDLSEEDIVGTDSIFFMRQAIQAGYTLNVEPSMHYLHTVHDGSHWLQNSAESSRLLGLRNWNV